jgi:hypothetical protein
MWKAEGNIVHLAIDDLEAQLNLRQPGRGLFRLHWLDQLLGDAAILQIRSTAATTAEEDLSESYVRGTDLIATYGQRAERTIVPQVYWRAVQHVDLAVVGIELVVSVRTELLDDDPRLTVGSELPRCPVWRLPDDETARLEPLVRDAGDAVRHRIERPAVFVYRLSGADCSFIEMIHPMDFAGAELTGPAAGTRLRSLFQLFPERLEKGVIRRGRLQGLFVASLRAQAVARECYQRFADSTIPLTA